MIYSDYSKETGCKAKPKKKINHFKIYNPGDELKWRQPHGKIISLRFVCYLISLLTQFENVITERIAELKRVGNLIDILIENERQNVLCRRRETEKCKTEKVKEKMTIFFPF